ncbi:26S proteasome non-ATPase regulatory subunit 8 homolog A-like [Olea europaea subsp. europaea]|uniref:26S proteasome non-ATPase regulatory subunit 8 homolog A-like n=1 Tax=Olea europaea subsp. europaea TaxID=158383 RepID=A0A8S0QNK0_OLEEU|nr:26S proteasome non-ATPase regulatory subunit 8 homolog A-like [Olea europaea subsp. europaea]
MDPKFTEVSQVFQLFKAAFVRKDFDTCIKLLSQLKVTLTEFKSLPPLFEETPNAIQERTLASNNNLLLYLITLVAIFITFFEFSFFSSNNCNLINYRGHI